VPAIRSADRHFLAVRHDQSLKLCRRGNAAARRLCKAAGGGNGAEQQDAAGKTHGFHPRPLAAARLSAI
jgi:hypothetical protein